MDIKWFRFQGKPSLAIDTKYLQMFSQRALAAFYMFYDKGRDK